MDKTELLIKQLALKAIKMSKNKASEIEKFTWMIVHEYHHGAMPFEYDIRDIDESLYIKVLNYAKIELNTKKI